MLINVFIDLSGEIKNEGKQSSPTYKDALEWLKYDLQVSREELYWLKNLIEIAQCDITTYDIFKEYYKDEEEDMYWAKQRLELI